TLLSYVPVHWCLGKASNGILCTVDLSRKSLSAMMGNQNCHTEITFDDNVKWLLRFRLAATPWQKEKAIQQLADIFVEIEKLPFKVIGLLISRGVIEVQGLAEPLTYQVGKAPLGPFSSPLERV
ncbi:hypothetical protein N7447_006941, partial [Penicillium robsamsonii]|uniref:uncharacterized protein n=1 Tax=Penicillium robsamsonii TaxID=1792511 RepID=UPI0025494C72